jgi:hypothetical protein
VVIDFTWKLSEMNLVGAPTFQNTKTTLGKFSDREPTCLPPVLKGEYEHFELLGIKEGLSGALELQVKTTVVSRVSFAMPLPYSDALRVSPDKKSLVAKKNGWTWTYTPSIVQK